jgi:short-subunit dehydrogenase
MSQPSSPQPSSSKRKLAIVTGASSGIGRELARQCALAGYDLVIAADEPEIAEAAKSIGTTDGALDCEVMAVECDLATEAGVAKLIRAVNGRPVDALLANAGRALGHAFLDQAPDEQMRLIDTNIRGTVMLLWSIGRRMRERRQGRILITSSIAAFSPAPFNALYNASKAFLYSLSYALRNEFADYGVSVTCLMPGLTESEILRRAHEEDTRLATDPKMTAEEVAQQGLSAMERGDAGVITGFENKLTAFREWLTPAEKNAAATRKETEPGTAEL